LADGQTIGETFCLGERADVVGALGLPRGTRTGFAILCRAEGAGLPELPITIQGRWGDQTFDLIAARVALIGTDYRTAPFGQVLAADYRPVLHREHVFTSGPSYAGRSEECLALIEKYAGPAPCRILDVGCGLGRYGQALLERGYDWTGAEMKSEDLAELERLRLPHRRIDGEKLPFPDGAADVVMCVEVLEHIADLPAFLAEMRRVAPAIVLSVPNFEIVPYLSAYQATPWHILEADHKNFFTRSSLRYLLEQFYSPVEITAYGRIPLPSIEGTPLFYHLFAAAGVFR
jgi:SAM-dependent methyltransferase